jgi:multidrug efflux pump subunit AcrB
MGASPEVAAAEGGAEVNLAVLAATLVDVVDFFPVTFLYGVSKFLFSALALAFCLSLLASFVVAMTVIPLFCSRFLKGVPHEHGAGEPPLEPIAVSWGGRFNAWFNRMFTALLNFYERWVRRALRRPVLTLGLLTGLFVASLSIYPLLGLAFFPQTDAGQFTINLKVPTGTRIEVTEQYVAKIEDLIRHTVDPHDLNMIVSNIGVVNDFSSLYTTNAGQYTATIQTALKEDHRVESPVYMDRVREALTSRFPDVRAFFQSGSMVDAILNTGMPAPIDVQVSSRNLEKTYRVAQDLSSRIRKLRGVGEVYIPQDMNYPALRLNVDRVHAAELGLSQKEIVENVITALNSNTMIAPNYWVDYKTGNDSLCAPWIRRHKSPVALARHHRKPFGQLLLEIRSIPHGIADRKCRPALYNQRIPILHPVPSPFLTMSLILDLFNLPLKSTIIRFSELSTCMSRQRARIWGRSPLPFARPLLAPDCLPISA